MWWLYLVGGMFLGGTVVVLFLTRAATAHARNLDQALAERESELFYLRGVARQVVAADRFRRDQAIADLRIALDRRPASFDRLDTV